MNDAMTLMRCVKTRILPTGSFATRGTYEGDLVLMNEDSATELDGDIYAMCYDPNNGSYLGRLNIDRFERVLC